MKHLTLNTKYRRIPASDKPTAMALNFFLASLSAFAMRKSLEISNDVTTNFFASP
jgi:hypothetical protein